MGRDRITVLPDWLLLFVGLAGMCAFLAAIIYFMPKDDGTNAPLPHGDHQARARQMHPGAAEARGRNDSDSVSSSDDEGGADSDEHDEL